MPLLEFISLTIIAVLWVRGIFHATGEDMILHELSEMVREVVGDWWAMPLFDCPYCMSSFHGALVYFTTLALGWHSLDSLGVFLFIPAVCGIQTLIKHD